jgi:lycopene cyclase CruP
MRGKRVAVVERGELRGRDQEWNISRRDMQARRHIRYALLAELMLHHAP